MHEKMNTNHTEEDDECVSVFLLREKKCQRRVYDVSSRLLLLLDETRSLFFPFSFHQLDEQA